MKKLLYLIRHGLAKHNENFLKYGEGTFFDPKYVDSMARQSQSKMLDEVGGKDFVLKRGNYAGTPVGS